jgi:four helix bundle protein
LPIDDCGLQIADCRLQDLRLTDWRFIEDLDRFGAGFFNVRVFSLMTVRIMGCNSLGHDTAGPCTSKATRRVSHAGDRVLRETSVNKRVATHHPAADDSAGSTDSNYRGACRGRSRKEFIAKIGVAAEEADESQGWLQALLAAGIGNKLETLALIKEADELIAIFVASEKTAKKNAKPIDNQSRTRNRT